MGLFEHDCELRERALRDKCPSVQVPLYPLPGPESVEGIPFIKPQKKDRHVPVRSEAVFVALFYIYCPQAARLHLPRGAIFGGSACVGSALLPERLNHPVLVAYLGMKGQKIINELVRSKIAIHRFLGSRGVRSRGVSCLRYIIF